MVALMYPDYCCMKHQIFSLSLPWLLSSFFCYLHIFTKQEHSSAIRESFPKRNFVVKKRNWICFQLKSVFTKPKEDYGLPFSCIESQLKHSFISSAFKVEVLDTKRLTWPFFSKFISAEVMGR